MRAVADHSTPMSSLVLSKISSSGSTLRPTSSRNKSSKASSTQRFKSKLKGSTEQATPEEKDRRSRRITGVPLLASLRGLARRTKSDPSIATTAGTAESMPSPVAKRPLDQEKKLGVQEVAKGATPSEDEGRSHKWYERGLKKARPSPSPDPMPLKPAPLGEAVQTTKTDGEAASGPYEMGQRVVKELGRLLGIGRTKGTPS